MRGHSPLANPYKVKPWGPYERGETLDLYKEWLDGSYIPGSSVFNEVNRLKEKLYHDGELRLTCCCAPRRCHGNVIKEFIEILVEIERGYNFST